MEANAGVRLNVLPSLNIEAGYRYIDMAGKDGNRDNTLADGAYAGVNFAFNSSQGLPVGSPCFVSAGQLHAFRTRLISCRPAILFSLR